MDIYTATGITLMTAAAVLPYELIAEVLSYLPVKILLRFRCVNKYWKALISDPVFVKLHLKRSASRNPKFTLVTHHNLDGDGYVMPLGCSVVPYSMPSLIENPSFTHSDINADCYFSCCEGNYHIIVGSCNGLICLLAAIGGECGHEVYGLRLWNPATRTTKDFGYFRDDAGSSQRGAFFPRDLFKFSFACDKSTDTYKVVASRYNPKHQLKSNVKILS